MKTAECARVPGAPQLMLCPSVHSHSQKFVYFIAIHILTISSISFSCFRRDRD
jgi:hypothetical protein